MKRRGYVRGFARSVKDYCNARLGVGVSIGMVRVHLPVVTTTVPQGPVPADPLVDPFARRVRYLRVSVTDRCNYRCTYCMPETLEDRMQFQPRAAVLTFEEIERIVTVFARLGVRKIRLTGGEPTV